MDILTPYAKCMPAHQCCSGKMEREQGEAYKESGSWIMSLPNLGTFEDLPICLRQDIDIDIERQVVS